MLLVEFLKLVTSNFNLLIKVLIIVVVPITRNDR